MGERVGLREFLKSISLRNGICLNMIFAWVIITFTIMIFTVSSLTKFSIASPRLPDARSNVFDQVLWKTLIIVRYSIPDSQAVR